jgi:hypothetical protein
MPWGFGSVRRQRKLVEVRAARPLGSSRMKNGCSDCCAVEKGTIRLWMRHIECLYRHKMEPRMLHAFAGM